MLDQAKQYLDMGYNVIPLVGKKPSGKWKHRQTEKMPLDVAKKHWGSGQKNIGIVCGQISGGLYVKDFDDKEAGREFYRQNKPILRTIVETRRGVHFYFRAQLRNTQGNKEDGRGEGGFVVAPPSRVNGWQYKFVNGHPLVRPEDLCEYPMEEEPTTVSSTSPRIVNGLSYIKSIRAESQNGGHNATFRAAFKLFESGMTELEVFAALIDWNRTNATPPWSTQELLHKVQDAGAKYIQQANAMIAAQDGCHSGACDIGGNMRG